MVLTVIRYSSLVTNTEDRVNYQLRTVTLDDAPGRLLAEHVHEVGARLESRDGGEVGGAGVEHTAAEHGDPPALALVHRVGQPRHDALHLLQHLRLLGADRGPLMSSEHTIKTQSAAEYINSSEHSKCCCELEVYKI